MFTVTIGPDNYYLQYDVKIGCYNDEGDGPNSTASIIYSAEGSECYLHYLYWKIKIRNILLFGVLFQNKKWLLIT